MLKLLAAAAFVAVAVPASAVTIDVSASGNTTDVPFFQTTQNFTLGSINGAKLNIASLTADDLVVVSINGTAIFGAGIYGPGNGYVYFTAAGPSTKFFFGGGGGVVNQSFTAPFVVGANTLTLTVNNNYAGINSGNGSLTGGPGSYNIVGTVTAGVPEPAMWGLMVAGFGLVGVATRRRTVVVAA